MPDLPNRAGRTVRTALLFVLCSLTALSALAADFKSAVPGYQFEFPRDHGSHEDYRTEWWYYTGHLRTESGHQYGFELTFFRVGVVPPGTVPMTRWDLRNVSLAHFAISDIDKTTFRYHEKLNRSSPFTANATAGRLSVFNEGWRATTNPNGSWRLIAADSGDAIDLTLHSQKPPAIHGENGISVKAEGPGFASHYYSMTRLLVEGRISVKGENAERCSGIAWMDHEFGSSALRENQQGWDWFSVQLDNDTELMLYQIRKRDGTPDATSSGSLISSDGDVIHLRHDQFVVRPLGRWRSSASGADYPMGWMVSVPSMRISLRIDPPFPNQELVTRESTRVTYWEGAAKVTGSFNGVSVSGSSYVEMTGYDRAFRQP